MGSACRCTTFQVPYSGRKILYRSYLEIPSMVATSFSSIPCDQHTLFTPIHSSAWKRNSANFALTEFSEVHRAMGWTYQRVLETLAASTYHSCCYVRRGRSCPVATILGRAAVLPLVGARLSGLAARRVFGHRGGGFDGGGGVRYSRRSLGGRGGRSGPSVAADPARPTGRLSSYPIHPSACKEQYAYG
jgi:hypothetical protein